jgi:hypothetical protein
MTRVLETVQAERAGRSHISPVSLVKLTTYTDRDDRTVDEIFYFSNLSTLYDYDNVGIDRNFWPVIVGGSDFVSGFTHLPSPTDLSSFRQSFNLHISNRTINGSRLIALLQAHNLEGASIEVSQLLLTKSEMDSYSDAQFLDLTNYQGTEHTVLFPGRVNRIAPISDSRLTIQCETELPTLSDFWLYLTDETKVDPIDLGKRAPYVYGTAKRVHLPSSQVGWVTSLTETINSTKTGSIEITDGSGLGSGTVRIDDEQIDISGATATTMTIALAGDRGVDGTSPAAHNAGAAVVEIVNSANYYLTWGIIDALDTLYVINPATGILTRLDNAVTPWTTVLNVGNIQISAAQMKGIFDYLNADFTGSLGFGLAFFADIDGVLSVAAPEWKTVVENFEVGTWSAANCTAELSTDRSTELAKSLKISVDLDSIATLREDCEATTNFTGTNCTVSVTSIESNPQGTNCIEADSDGTGSNSLLEYYDATWGLDLEGGGRFATAGYESIVLDFKIKKAGTGGNIRFTLGTSDGTDLVYVDIQVQDFPENTWKTIVFSPADMEDGVGSFDPTDVNYLAIEFNEPTRSADCKIYVDNIRTAPRNHVVQQNALGGRNYDGYQDNLFSDVWKDYTYELPDLGPDLASSRGDIIISEDEVSGTTLPTNYRWHRFVYNGNFGAWYDSESTDSTEVGAATDATNVHTLRIILRTPGGIQDLDPTIVWYVDNLRRQYEAPVEYYAGPGGGDLLNYPADIIRHWIEVVGGEKLDMTSYASLHTALTTAVVWACDVRALGLTWEEVLQRMAFEARCNIVAVQTAEGRMWKILHADNDYGFGAAPAANVITQTHGITDIGRSMDDIASRFTFRYAFDASLGRGGSEESYTLALEANPTTSDVPITTTLIGNAEARFGARDAGPIAFRLLRDKTSAQDVAGYMVQERMANDRSVYRLEDVAWFDALVYEIGDIVSITPPWASSASLCRITSMAKAFDDHTWTITAVEVLETGTRTP